MNFIVFIIWLALVSIWNLGWPGATPIMDIIIAVGLSFLSMLLNKFLVNSHE